MSTLTEISEALQQGSAKQVKALVSAAIDEGLSANEILQNGLLAGMNVVGAKFRNNEVFIPEVLVAARAMNAGTALLKPLMGGDAAQSYGKAVVGTVKGDLHDIGKNLVRMMFECKGIEVIDLGVDVEPAAFVAAAKEHGCGVIACSALLTTTMAVMADVVKAAEAAGIRDKVCIMVGGAPVTQQFCDAIHADVYTPDAAAAAEKALERLTA